MRLHFDEPDRLVSRVLQVHEIRHMKRKENQGIGRGRVRICLRAELLQRLRGALRSGVRAMAAVTWAVLGFVWRVPSKRKGLVPARTIPSFENFVRRNGRNGGVSRPHASAALRKMVMNLLAEAHPQRNWPKADPVQPWGSRLGVSCRGRPGMLNRLPSTCPPIA